MSRPPPLPQLPDLALSLQLPDVALPLRLSDLELLLQLPDLAMQPPFSNLALKGALRQLRKRVGPWGSSHVPKLKLLIMWLV
jgi:hypothetical protein